MTTQTSAWAPGLPGAHARFTSATDGNLALHVGDDPRVVARNRALLEAEYGTPIVFVNQVHSPTVVTVRSTSEAAALQGKAPDADALVTDCAGVALAMMVADCLPVLFVDPDAAVIGAAHAGRRGLLDGIIGATVAAMVSLGADPASIHAAIGPSVCGSCYEVPEAMRVESSDLNPAVHASTAWGTPSLDLKAGARWALEDAGIARGNVSDVGVCTFESHDFFSYRRDAQTGRFAGIIGLSSARLNET